MRKIGSFSIAVPLVEDSPEIVRLIMGKCAIIRCEMIYHEGAFEYIALCDDFAEVPPEGKIPEYNVIVHNNGERIEFKQKEAI